jgi:hypothetical protein
MVDTMDDLHVIWLQPTCPECDRMFNHYDSEGRVWADERFEDCEECGRAWVKYELALDQPLDTKEADG